MTPTIQILKNHDLQQIVCPNMSTLLQQNLKHDLYLILTLIAKWTLIILFD